MSNSSAGKNQTLLIVSLIIALAAVIVCATGLAAVKKSGSDNPTSSSGGDSYRPVKFVAPNGNNSNSGDSRSEPYATVAKAISENAHTVFLEQGSYSECITVSDVDIEIIGLGSGAVFDGLAGNVFYFTDSSVRLVNISVTNTTGVAGSGMRFTKCRGSVEDCRCENNQYMGFRLLGSQMTFIRCRAENSGVDGFNGHDYTENGVDYTCDCTFIDCSAIGCGDDGLSFHENGHMTVYGGEYGHCASTGIAPHGNCSAEIHNAYIHHNGRTAHSGIEAYNPEYTGGPKARIMTFGNLITNNGKYGIDLSNDILISTGDIFSENGTGTINTSGFGAEVTVTTFPVLTTSTAPGKAALCWTAVPGASQYRIYRCVFVDGSWSDWVTVERTVKSTAWSDSSVVPGATYKYWVRALVSDVWSAYSNAETVAIPFVPALSVTADAGKNMLSWSAVPGAAQYRVYRRVFEKGSWSRWITVCPKVTETKWNDTSVTADTHYKYKVRAYVNGVWTDYSNDVSLIAK